MRALVVGLVLALTVTGCGADEPGEAPRPKSHRFDSGAAFALLREQVELGPRPAGSAASRKLARRLRSLLPEGRFARLPGGLRNVIGFVRGRDPARLVVVGAHYDSKDLPHFLGANDGASGTAVAVELARGLRPRALRPSVEFVLFDGEETPRGTPDSEFEERGLRGSRAAAPGLRRARAMILLDFVGDKRLRLPREESSDKPLWERMRAAARKVGEQAVFPPTKRGPVLDDHTPFLDQGVPSVDLIDFDFDCFHKACDNLSAVSERSLDAVGETMIELLTTL